jgi:hypothetical protein
MPITPQSGSNLHAETHLIQLSELDTYEKVAPKAAFIPVHKRSYLRNNRAAAGIGG